MGNLKETRADYKPLGYSEMQVPMYVARMDINAYAVIEIKEGRYRITINKIDLIQRYDDALSEKGERSELVTWAVGNNEFKRAFLKKPVEIYEYTFNNLFKMDTTQEEW